MRKKINHINFDTRDSYGDVNTLKLNTVFLSSDYDVPLWGTENQFENNGMTVKKGEEPVKLLFKSDVDSRGIGDVKHYPVFNFSQTESGNEVYWSKK